MTDHLPELTDDDLDVLAEALEAWEAKDAAGEMAELMLDAALRDRAGPPPAHIAAELERQKREKALAKRTRKERSVLLRAKLITLRDRRRADSFTRDALDRKRDDG